MTPKQNRDIAIRRMVLRGLRMGMTMADVLAGTEIPVSRVKRIIAKPCPKSPNPTQGKAR